MSETSNPLVSVILPAYNHAEFIEACILSVSNQTYKNLEIIIIDDGSKDATKEVTEHLLKKLQDPRIRFISQENIGPSITINKGIKLSRGTLTTILNTDDVFFPTRIEELVRAHLQTKSEFIFTKVSHIDAAGSKLPSTHPHKKWYDQALLNLILEPSIGFAMLKANSAVTTGNFFFTRRLFEQLNGFSHQRVAHDLDFILRAILLTEPHFINSELMGYRVHGNNDIIRSAHLIKPEMESILANFFYLQFTSEIRNSLAPTQNNWPSYFISFIRRNNMDIIFRKAFTKLLSEQTQTTKGETTQIQSKQKPKGTKKIHLVSHDLSLTGAPALIYELALQLRAKNYTPVIYSPRTGLLLDTIEDQQIPFHRIWFGKWIERGTYARKLAELAFSILECGWHFSGEVILNSIANWPLLIPIFLNPRVKKIYFYIHEDFSPDNYVESRMARKYVRKILLSRKVDLWFGSNYTKEIWQRIGYQGKLQYFSGFDCLKSLPTSNQQRPEGPTRFLFVGTFTSRKGIAYLFSAFQRVAAVSKHPFILDIVGVDTNMDDFTLDLSKRIYEFNLAQKNKINLIAQTSPESLNAFYENAHVYITASLSECLPLAVLNAMRHGLPVISTNVGGCSEAVMNETSGFITPPRESERLEHAILYFLENPSQIRNMGLESVKIFKEKFANETVLPQFISQLSP